MERNTNGQFKKGQRNELLWKGDNAGYTAKHAWARRHFGTPQECEDCGTTEKRKYEWANISRKYLRIRSDWKRLCVPCHNIFDNKTTARGEKNGNVKLTEMQVKFIKRWLYFNDKTVRELAQQFKITTATIRQIQKGTTWKHVTNFFYIT